MRVKAAEEGKRIIADQAGPSMQKGVEKVLSDIFLVRFDEPSTALKNLSYYFNEGVFTEITLKDTLNELFKRNLKRWT